MAQLEIRLLGPLQITQDGKPLTNIRSDKARSLLAYLAVEAGKPHRREKLAGLLWPDYPEPSARANLRRALSDLRQALGDEQAVSPYLDITPKTIQFETGSDAWVDASAFQSLVRSSPPFNEETLKGGYDAIGLYQGEFMEGFTLPDSPAFEEWVLLNRERFNRLALDLLQRLAETYEEKGEYGQALTFARRQLELDPLRESAHRQVMRLLALSGQREASIAQYESCARVLSTELGVEPSAETWELYQALLKGDLPVRAPLQINPAQRESREIGVSPYRGLSAFREQDAPFFFGRGAFIQQLLGAVRARGAPAVILGASGSGKSSVVYAGLLPSLRDAGEWLVADLRPGASPFHALAGTLLPLLEPGLTETDRLVESQKLAAALNEGTLPLCRLVERVLEKHTEQSRLLLFIDQFEELYTLCHQPEIRRSFLDGLLETVETYRDRRTVRFALVLTMRADFLGQTLTYRPFADLLQSASLMIGPMTRSELRTAVEQPALVQGAAFESGLVERILDDVGEEPGNLPLLEFALLLLWERAESGWLTHSGYESIGEVRGALARYAEHVYDGLDEADRESAKQVFLQLIRPGEGTQDTRRVATRAEIGEANWPLVQLLADRRLVVTGRDLSANETAEVVHEALIAGWGQLREWIEADRAFRTWQERLRSALRQWDISGKDEDALLRGAPLAEAEGWLAERASDLANSEMEYLQASRELRRRRQSERERARRRIVGGLTAGLVITLVLAVLALWQWRAAQHSRAVAEVERDLARQSLSRSLASQAQLLVEEDLDLASLLSIEAANIDPSVETRSSLLAALTAQPQLASVLHGHQDEVLAAAFSPDGFHLATGDAGGGVLLWEITDTTGGSLSTKSKPLEGHSDRITSLAFSPDGRFLASTGFDDTIRLWDIATGELAAAPLTEHKNNIWDLAFSPDGNTLISAGADGRVLLWDINSIPDRTGQLNRRQLVFRLGVVASLALSPDGRILAGGLGDGRVIVWNLDDSEPVGEPLIGHDRFVRALSFSPDGHILASGGDDTQIILWDMRRGSPTYGQPIGDPLTAHSDRITCLAFMPASHSLISTGKDGRVLSWDLSSMFVSNRTPTPQELVGGHDPIWSLGIAPNGHRLVTDGEGGSAVLIDLTSVHPLALEIGSHPSYTPDIGFNPYATPDRWSYITSLAFNPDSQVLVSADMLGIMIFWDTAARTPLRSPLPVDPSIFSDPGFDPGGRTNVVKWDNLFYLPVLTSLAFSPDGKTVATAGNDNLIHLWDADPRSALFGKEVGPLLSAHESDVSAVAFDPKRKLLFSAGANNLNSEKILTVWDADETSVKFGEPLAQLRTDFKGYPNDTRGISWDLIFDRTGDLLVSLVAGEATIWDISTIPPKASYSFDVPHDLEKSLNGIVAFDPSNFVLAYAIESSITFFDLFPGSPSFGDALPISLQNPGGPIDALAFSPDGQLLISGNRHGELQLWDVARREMIGPILSGVHPILGLAFSPDGSALAVGGTRGSVFLWDMSLDSWKAHACQRANRNLTPEEWRRFFGEEPYRETCPGL